MFYFRCVTKNRSGRRISCNFGFPGNSFHLKHGTVMLDVMQTCKKFVLIISMEAMSKAVAEDQVQHQQQQTMKNDTKGTLST